MEAQDGLHELFINSVENYAIYLLDPRGHVLTWNQGAQRIKGYAADEIVGQHLSVFYPPDARPTADEVLGIAAETGSYEGASWRLRKDGSTVFGQRLPHRLAGRRRRTSGASRKLPVTSPSSTRPRRN